MPRSYRKNIIRTFRSTKSRFIAIFSIVALGVGFLAGLMSTTPDMRDSMEAYLDGANFYDLRVVSTLGLSDTDIDALRAVEGVRQVQPGYAQDLLVTFGGDTLVARARDLPDPDDADAVDRLTLAEGRWPAAPGECVVAVGTGSLRAAGPQVGDAFAASPDNEDLSDALAVTRFTVVGRVRSANYFSIEREAASVGDGSVAVLFYLQPSDFAYEVYTDAYLTVDGAFELASLGQKYKDAVEVVENRVEALEDTRAPARLEEVRADARKEIDDGWAEYNDARAEADEEFAKAEQELADARQELADGEQDYADGQKELADAEKEVADGERELADAAQKLADAERELADGRQQLEDGRRELADAEQQLADAQAQYDDGVAQLEDGQRQLDEARQTLNSGEADYAAGMAKWNEGYAAYAQGKQLADGAQALAENWTDLYNAGATLVQLRGIQSGIQTVQSFLSAQEETLIPAYQDWAAVRDDGSVDAAEKGAKETALNTAIEAYNTQRGTYNALLISAGQLPLPELTKDDNIPEKIHEVIQPINATADQIEKGIQGIEKRQADAVTVLIALGFAADADAAEGLLGELSPPLELGPKAAALQNTLANSKKELDAGAEDLAAGRAELDAGWAELNTQNGVLEQGKKELADAKIQLDDGYAELEQGRADLAEAEQAVLDGERELTDGRRDYADGKKELEDGKKELADGRVELADAWQKILDGRQELADGEAEYAEEKADAEAELADAKAELEDAEAELADLELPEWYVWDRSANTSFHSFEGNVNKVEAIARVFPIFFFLVAALVVSTTMTRMVEEERLQIGTMKAMGYARPAIMQKYVWYAAIAAVLGALVGLALGFTVFPSVIWYAYEMMYYMPHLATPWRANYATMAGGLLIGCALVATLSACQATMRETPADLMRPRAPKAGKRIILERITPLWRRLPFTYKVTCRNLLRYKKRFWMTVLGVAGCTALLVTGFGISDSLNGIAIKQYGDIYKYHLLTAVTDSADTAQGEVHDYLFGDAAFTESLAVSTALVNEEMPDGSLNEVYLMAPQDAEAFGRFVDLRERVGRAPVPLTDDGVILTEKLAATIGVGAGDTVTLENADGQKAAFTVTGVCEHYVMNYAYIGPAAWQQAYGAAPEYNAVLSLLVDDGAESHAAISAKLLGMDGVAAVNFTTDQRTAVLNMLNSINAVVVLIIVCAASLAFVVLYNLTNINIAERVKEIATIKVLGFYDREVSAYVNRESVALTVIGALLGLVGGIGLHKFVIYTVEVDAVMFGRDIEPVSFVYALALTLLFSTMVNLVMGRKLKNISMVESMKAPE